MFPIAHFITSAIVILIVNLFYPASLFQILLGIFVSVFVDLDHFVIKIIKDKNFNVFKIFLKTFPDARKFSDEINLTGCNLVRLLTHSFILILFIIFYPAVPVIAGLLTHIVSDIISDFFS